MSNSDYRREREDGQGALPTWLESFPELRAPGAGPWWGEARLAEIGPGRRLFGEGDACVAYAMVVEGCVRVQKVDPAGREIVLYRVERGQTCMLTTACLLASLPYPAEGIAEEPTRLAMLPLPVFEEALADSAPFRRFVMSGIGRRVGDLMLLVEDVAFHRMDLRLARLLARMASGRGPRLACTHRELAVELGTAREVVSRLLKDFERRGWLALGRGRVEVRDAAALARHGG